VHDRARVQEGHAGGDLGRGGQHGGHVDAALQLAALRAEPALVDGLLRARARARLTSLPRLRTGWKAPAPAVRQPTRASRDARASQDEGDAARGRPRACGALRARAQGARARPAAGPDAGRRGGHGRRACRQPLSQYSSSSHAWPAKPRPSPAGAGASAAAAAAAPPSSAAAASAGARSGLAPRGEPAGPVEAAESCRRPRGGSTQCASVPTTPACARPSMITASSGCPPRVRTVAPSSITCAIPPVTRRRPQTRYRAAARELESGALHA